MSPVTRAVSTSLPSSRAFAGAPPALRPPARLMAFLVALVAVRRSRRTLLDLDGHLLRDVGLTREAAEAEAARPAWDALDRVPWDAPAHWLR